ncbi:oxygenase MpaB family protein [Ornithinimicrobium sp. W1679]|uniref:oxygenase MpaB family protein n=1 Tax=Ornithinimicrobium sp. W1679 TaxID=3418770 RepID=UPI003CEB5F9F
MHVSPLVRVQTALGSALRSRVAGDDAQERARLIWQTPGERWFTPQDPVWRVHADAAMFPGGVSALLLQMLHPMAMAGVAGHSGYRSDPWGRLQRTSTYLAATTFGTVEHARATIGQVRAVHERVRGKDAFGRPYRASDPRLLMWVHVAEAVSFLRAFQAYAAAPLTAEEADAYVAQAGVSAGLLGVVDPPGSVAELHAVLEGFRPELETTSAAQEAARFLLAEPPLPRASRPGYWAIAAGGVALLEPWAREMLDLPSSPLLSRSLLRPVGRVSTAGVRWAMAGVDDSRQPAA